jgi:hypothetical protein
MAADLALRHLALRLRPLHRALQVLVRRQAEAAARLARPDIAHLCITDDQVDALLADAGSLLDGIVANDDGGADLNGEERVLESALRARAAASGDELPLDALARLRQLSPFEQQALLLCAAPELDRCYERIYGYVLDDMNRRHPCIELLCAVGSGNLGTRLAQRDALGPHGALRRTGMLHAWGEAASELRQELRLGPGMLACLCGKGAPEAFLDPAEVPCDDAHAVSVDALQLARMAHGLRDGMVAVVGVWGPARAGHAEVAKALARDAGRPLRRLQMEGGAGAALRHALDAAAATGAMLWIPVDPWHEDDSARARDQLATTLARSRVPLVLTGTSAWRPLELLAVRAYAEMHIEPPGWNARQQLWSQALPDVGTEQAADLAGRYRVGAGEVRAASLAARTAARLAANGDAQVIGPARHVDAACAVVLRPGSQRYATLVEPRRGRDDLVLPPALHRQVLEVASFYRAWPMVADGWGFGHLASGRGGIKALFTGDSGTGKTLAAEVVAGELGMPLLKIDLSQILSKWIGETEKHLESVFTEAEDSHGVLFFDEADALFGKRGEVRHGMDRYANVEVSYLLQRLEDHAGLVILASNLRDNIDAAFTRRFHVVVQFPRPQLKERQRIWEIAFPAGAALDEGVDLDLLARLDLTGAGITGAARTAALLAAADGCGAIGRSHIVRAIARQYQSEARVLMPAELGVYAGFLQDAK